MKYNRGFLKANQKHFRITEFMDSSVVLRFADVQVVENTRMTVAGGT
jgi:hypothetical protein